MYTHHVPELVKGHDEARAHAPQSLKGPDVNFDPHPLLNAAVQLTQRTAFTHWGDTWHTGHTAASTTDKSWKEFIL